MDKQRAGPASNGTRKAMETCTEQGNGKANGTGTTVRNDGHVDDVTSSLSSRRYLQQSFVALASGAGAGLVADASTHAMDTCRTRQMVHRGSGGYRGTAHAFVDILKTEGFRGLYRGFAIVGMFTVPAHALYFAGYEVTKLTLQPNVPNDEKSAITHFAAGSVAELLGASLWCPMDVIKQRMQVQRRNTTITSVVRTVYSHAGIGGFFSGYMMGLATYCPFVGIYFVCYEQGKRLFARAYNSEESSELSSTDNLPSHAHLLSGFASGAIAASVTNPLDVIKTRVQVGAKDGGSSSISHVWREMCAESKGRLWRTLSKGITARVMWIAPSCAVTLVSYEWFKQHLEQIVIT